MHGTVVCALTDGAENGDAVAKASAISERLGLRLVLAHVVDGINTAGDESITMKGDRVAATRELAELLRDHGVDERAEARVAVGDPATLVGRIASEEAADVIVVGARRRGWGRGLESKLAEELEMETPVPVLVAPPRVRNARKRTSAHAAAPR
jgi:nucleotide-binding universal stress UspA family protein